jgi:transposase
MDWALHKARHLVENAFAKLEQFRTVATRFDKLKQSYENTVALACAYLWLKLSMLNRPNNV